MVDGVENAGVPDTADGGQVADIVSDWADASLDDLEDAEDSSDEEADLEEVDPAAHWKLRAPSPRC